MSLQLRLDTTVVASKDQISCDVAQEGVILHMGRGKYFGLDEVANAIWHLVQQPRTLAEVRDRITEQYEVGAEECDRDLLEFMQAMHAAGLIEVVEGAAD